MGKSKQNQETDQKHKKHNSKSDKLKKKHDLKKKRRQIKEDRSQHKLIKKHKERLKKLKLASDEFALKVSSEDIYTVKKIIGKLLNHNMDSIKELPELFDMIDNGFDVDLSNLTDDYVMQKLNKAFKLLKLQRHKENKLEFKKIEKLHDFKLKAMIQHFIDDIMAEKKNNESDGSIDDESEMSDDDGKRGRKKSRSRERDLKRRSGSESSNESSSQSDSKKKQKKHLEERKTTVVQEDKVSKLDKMNKFINDMQYQKVRQESSDDESEEEVGPKMDPEAGQDFLESTLGLLSKGKDANQGPNNEIEMELNKMFEGAGQARSKKPIQQAEVNTKKYLGVVDKKLTEEEEQLRQVAIKDYLDEYNTHFRQKTLLEQHLEKKKDKSSKDHRTHEEKMKDQMSRPLDRNRDIKYSGIDSKKAFNIVNKNNLDKRFTPGSSYL